jgi:oligosaccharyltransferase complex subunit gamma
MRLQLSSSALCVAGLLLPSLVLAARSSAKVSKRDKFRSLVKNGVVELNSALYDELTDGPRDYSVSVVLTAMAPQYKCAPCQ